MNHLKINQYLNFKFPILFCYLINNYLISLQIYNWLHPNLKFYYSPLYHDYRPELTSIFELKKYTEPRDVVYWDAPTGHFEIQTYSQRNVGLSETAKLIGKSDEKGGVYLPTIFRFDSPKPQLELTQHSDQIWIDGSREFILYRTRATGQFAFLPSKHVAVLSSMVGAGKLNPFKERWETCQSVDGVRIQLPEGIKEIQVLSEDNKIIGQFPGNKKILNLPSESPWGCLFRVKLVS